MAQFGSAPSWGDGGHRFKSCYSESKKVLDTYHEIYTKVVTDVFYYYTTRYYRYSDRNVMYLYGCLVHSLYFYQVNERDF